MGGHLITFAEGELLSNRREQSNLTDTFTSSATFRLSLNYDTLLHTTHLYPIGAFAWGNKDRARNNFRPLYQ